MMLVVRYQKNMTLEIRKKQIVSIFFMVLRICVKHTKITVQY